MIYLLSMIKIKLIKIYTVIKSKMINIFIMLLSYSLINKLKNPEMKILNINR